MKYLTNYSDENIYKSAMLDFYFKDMNIGVLDIETTGLNPSKNKFILGGLYNFKDKTIHQFLAENKSEEKDALCEFKKKLSKTDMVITYNGRHFDIPFIEKRMKNFSADIGSMPYNLDLYLVLNGHSPIKKFVPNLKQKTVENYMGLWQNRQDEISGAESVELYNTYEKNHDPKLEAKILLHNSDDVLQLTRLLKVISKSDFHKAMYHLGFPAGPLTVQKIDITRDFMIITGIQRDISLNYIGFSFEDFPAESRFEAKTGSFTFKIPLIRNSAMAIIDLDAAYVDRKTFEIYPVYSSGFLIVENHSQKNYMEINHFVKKFIEIFLNKINI